MGKLDDRVVPEVSASWIDICFHDGEKRHLEPQTRKRGVKLTLILDKEA